MHTTDPQVSRDCSLAVDGGLDVTNAVQIVAALELHPTKGSINVAMSLDRKQQPTGKGAVQPLKGIGDYYHRVFIHEGDKCVAIRFHKYFELGEGLRVEMSRLRSLWRSEEELDAAADARPALLQTAGSTRKPVAKQAESESAAAATKKMKEARKNARLQRAFLEDAAKQAAEQRRLEESKASICRYAGLGCRKGSFLTSRHAEQHAERHCPFRPDAPHPPSQPRVRMLVWNGRNNNGKKGRKGPCRLQLSTVSDGSGGFSVCASVTGVPAGRGILTHMRVERPLAPARAYGMPTFRVLEEVATRIELAAVNAFRVH